MRLSTCRLWPPNRCNGGCFDPYRPYREICRGCGIAPGDWFISSLWVRLHPEPSPPAPGKRQTKPAFNIHHGPLCDPCAEAIRAEYRRKAE